MDKINTLLTRIVFLIVEYLGGPHVLGWTVAANHAAADPVEVPDMDDDDSPATIKAKIAELAAVLAHHETVSPALGIPKGKTAIPTALMSPAAQQLAAAMAKGGKPTAPATRGVKYVLAPDIAKKASMVKALNGNNSSVFMALKASGKAGARATDIASALPMKIKSVESALHALRTMGVAKSVPLS